MTARRRRPAAEPGAPVTKEASERAIGIFDSGIGGLTVVKALLDLLPAETLLYLGDTARTPYGTKSAETVLRYSFENAEFLLEKGIKLLVVACNTSSAVAVDALAERYDVPIVGVIEPGATAALAATRNRKIGVIGTEGTIRTGSYTRALRRLASDLEIYTRACPLFVPLAEEGWVDNEVARSTARLYLGTLCRSGIDTLILGCTHYPLLNGVVGELMGQGVHFIDSAGVTAEAVGDVLAERGLLSEAGEGSVSFFVTDAPERFVRVGSRFLGRQIDSAVQIDR